MTKPDRVESWRRVVVVFKLATGGAELGLGITILALSAAGFDRLVGRLLNTGLRHDPNGSVFVFVERHLPALLAGKEWIALGLLALGGLKVAGAVGLLLGRPWAYHLLVALLVLLVPVDAYHVATRPSITGAVLLLLNVGALGILLRYRRALLVVEGG
ncbi:MAG: DUF2127 domain-containing protein [Acidobacteriia bacterium]|nr:DUF2127 domain-containing protein [Terriglobia bacterium]